MNPEQSTSFLDLPPELRNEIYTLALQDDKPIPVSSYTTRLYRPPSLLLTNKQTHEEATPIFYNIRIFDVVPCSPMMWLCRIPEKYQGFITCIYSGETIDEADVKAKFEAYNKLAAIHATNFRRGVIWLLVRRKRRLVWMNEFGQQKKFDLGIRLIRCGKLHTPRMSGT